MTLARMATAALVGLLAVSTFAAPVHASPPEKLTPKAIDSYLENVMDTTDLPGVSVAVTHDGKVVHAAGYGHDSRGETITAETPMRVASVSKSFTAMAVMTLVDDKKIALDEPLKKQLPEFEMDDPRAADITVRQLLNQTSGLSDTTTDAQSLESSNSLKQLTSRLGDGKLQVDPGSQMTYCNANYDLAARLIEVVTGEPYSDYLQSAVYEPLGMKHSANSDQELAPAKGYNSAFGVWLPRAELPGFINDNGAGSVITSAADMGKWLSSQSGNGKQLVSDKSLATMHSPSKVSDYAMGWGVEKAGKTTQLVHAGNLFTYNAVEVLEPDSGYGVAVMSNSAPIVDDTYSIAQGVLALSKGDTPQGPHADRQTAELVMGLITLLAIGLAVMGVLRSRRWASKHATRAGWRIGLRLIPILLPLAVFAVYPDLVALLTRRTVTWAQLTYFALPVTLTLFGVALSCVVTVAVRLLRLWSLRSNG